MITAHPRRFIISIARRDDDVHATSTTPPPRPGTVPGVKSVHVAESGVQQAIAYAPEHQRRRAGAEWSPGRPPTGPTSTGSSPDPQPLPDRRRRHRWAPQRQLEGSRRLRVMMAPPRSFNYALFSLSDVTTKNNNVVCGDIWANTYVTVYQNDAVRAARQRLPRRLGGRAAASPRRRATSPCSTTARSTATRGQAATTRSGQAIMLDGGAHIGGFAKASSSSPGCADDLGHSRYKVDNGGTIDGTVTTWGTVIRAPA